MFLLVKVGVRKSTLFNLILGRLKENEGQILIDNKKIENGDIENKHQMDY
ncbi:ATP-binding cassette domain-containing protein, partial [Streptobacillus felis]